MDKDRRAEKRGLSKKSKDAVFIYGFLAWPILHFLVFWVAMNVGTVYNSFFEISIVNGRTFVWFENYKEMFRFIFGVKERGILNWHGVLNSLSLIPLAVFINMPITLFFAYGIYKKVFGYKVFRTVLFLPAIVSTVVLCLAFRLALDSQKGIIVPNLRLFGLAGDGSGYDTGVVPVGGW
ncbi:MAG: sugar ABC transporter permease, partial [Clostridia bacterium]|nr:sugar ABC transporter permease [Clostridia bacterium]